MKRKRAQALTVVLFLSSVAWFILWEGIDNIVFWLRLELVGFSSWEANQAHYMAHPMSLVFLLTLLMLPVALFLALLNKRRAYLVAIALVGYFPLYLFYGSFCHPYGFSPPPLAWLVITTCVALVEWGLWCSYKISEPNIGQVSSDGAPSDEPST